MVWELCKIWLCCPSWLEPCIGFPLLLTCRPKSSPRLYPPWPHSFLDLILHYSPSMFSSGFLAHASFCLPFAHVSAESAVLFFLSPSPGQPSTEPLAINMHSFFASASLNLADQMRSMPCRLPGLSYWWRKGSGGWPGLGRGHRDNRPRGLPCPSVPVTMGLLVVGGGSLRDYTHSLPTSEYWQILYSFART